MRIWDAAHATTCTIDLGAVTEGRVVAVVAWALTDPRPKQPDPSLPAATSRRRGHEIAPGAADYFVGGCGTQFELLSGPEAIESLRRRLDAAGK